MDKIKGFVIAGTNSGAGKTTVSLGIMAWLSKQGYKVAPFKVGPDFIDPGHHTRITGSKSRNLDGWMLSRGYNIKTLNQFSTKADVAVVEGVMGLYDGYDGKSDVGSTAQMAKWLGLPVILVVNAKSMARGAAALVKGFVEFDPELDFAGVVFNNLGSQNHYRYLTDAMEEYVSVPVLGGILRNQQITIPERHLGLVTDDDHMLTQEYIDRLVGLIDQGMDTATMVTGLEKNTASKPGIEKKTPNNATVQIGVARDAAFCFYYQDNLEMLESKGADLVFFSPMANARLPDNLAGLYFGGGYPELFADRLSKNKIMCADVKRASDQGMPIYGECGGFMYLCSSFFEQTGKEYPLTGCFPYYTRLLDRLKALGYREVCLTADTIVGSKGMKARGHEFHYSELVDPDSLNNYKDVKPVYSISARRVGSTLKEGFYRKRTLGSYVHLHFGSNPKFCNYFVKACKDYKKIKN